LCAPCNDGLFCSATDGCQEGVCVGFGDPCGVGEVCNETTDTCEPECGLDCSSFDDQCNTGVCNPTTSQCELLPMPVGTSCAPDGGSRQIFCFDGICTHWCNHSYMIPGDGDHECPVGYACEMFTDTDSAGYCKPNPYFGSKITGENCDDPSECRSFVEWAYNCTDGRCLDHCSSTADCKDTGPGTSDWTCQPKNFFAHGARFDHGLCEPALGNRRPGESCGSPDECRDAFCLSPGECANMCCTEEDCQTDTPGYACWWWEGGESNSTIRACMDKGALGTDGFGTACNGSDFFDASCATGLCIDVDGAERCNRFCCRNADCSIYGDYVCDFAFEVTRQGNKINRIRACVPTPTLPQFPEQEPDDSCLPGDACGSPIVVSSFPASINDDNTDYNNYLTPHDGVSCTGWNYWGLDVIYEVLVPDGSTLDSTMTPPGGVDLGLYLLANCVPDFTSGDCLDGSDDGVGGDPESVSWTNNTGSDATVYVVVDGWNIDQIGPYTLDIDVTP
jgi:hypothetical protein